MQGPLLLRDWLTWKAYFCILQLWSLSCDIEDWQLFQYPERGCQFWNLFYRWCECRQLGSEYKATCMLSGDVKLLASAVPLTAVFWLKSPCRKGIVWGTTCGPTCWICNHFPLFIAQLARRLPARVQGYPWRLAYSTLEHGTSLKTLYRKSASLDSPVLLVIKDMDNQVRSACSARVGLKGQHYKKLLLWSASHAVKWHHAKIRHWCLFSFIFSTG